MPLWPSSSSHNCIVLQDCLTFLFNVKKTQQWLLKACESLRLIINTVILTTFLSLSCQCPPPPTTTTLSNPFHWLLFLPCTSVSWKLLWHKQPLNGRLNEHGAQSARWVCVCVGGRKIVLLINGVIKVLSLTSHWLTGMDGLLAPAPGSHSIMNGSYYQRVWVVIEPPAEAWLPRLSALPHPPPKPFICS